ncbi:MAG: winged helix-turn-helix transcriptional regulator, partial [Burkholderiales bacterium]|nr:winged helix-turn-helix transcriptional regulator [Burkholderiales bacterium]
ADAARISQPAATQTVAMMAKEGLVEVAAGEADARQRVVALSAPGRALLPRLQHAWQATDHAAAGLDAETGLLAAVAATLAALDRQPFAQRIAAARQQDTPPTTPKRKIR